MTTPPTTNERFEASVSELDAALAQHGITDRQDAYRMPGVNVSVGARAVAMAADRLRGGQRILAQMAEREQQLRQRVTRLESQMGALRVDGDRRAAVAYERAEGAWQVATDALAVLREHGIEPGADLPTLVEDANRFGNFLAQAAAEERERLETFRLSMVGLIDGMRARSGYAKGMTPEECGKLGRAIDRANNKALGR